MLSKSVEGNGLEGFHVIVIRQCELVELRRDSLGLERVDMTEYSEIDIRVGGLRALRSRAEKPYFDNFWMRLKYATHQRQFGRKERRWNPHSSLLAAKYSCKAPSAGRYRSAIASTAAVNTFRSYV